ncbi:Small auxin-up RNA [Sesbania bispinosa]|nr:Small auxin-up RNA [Sesbania bispinosa]
MAIKVGQGEEQQRITVPVNYLNHPLFIQLLKEAEEEYGFSHQGTIVIPCQVAEFKNVQHLIDTDQMSHHHLVGCFRA